VGFADLEGDVVARGGEDLSFGPAAVAIEDGDGLAGADAEDLGEVAGFVSGECAALPIGRREVEAGHGERLKTPGRKTQDGKVENAVEWGFDFPARQGAMGADGRSSALPAGVFGRIGFP
jgi:hypothetical protein